MLVPVVMVMVEVLAVVQVRCECWCGANCSERGVAFVAGYGSVGVSSVLERLAGLLQSRGRGSSDSVLASAAFKYNCSSTAAACVSVGVKKELLVRRRSNSLEGGVFRCDRKCEEECRKIGPLPNLSPPLSHSECERGFVCLGEAKERGRKRAGGSQPKMCEVIM